MPEIHPLRFDLLIFRQADEGEITGGGGFQELLTVRDKLYFHLTQAQAQYFNIDITRKSTDQQNQPANLLLTASEIHCSPSATC